MVATFILAAFGLSAIYSIALSAHAGDVSNLVKQGIAVIAGFVLIGALSLSNYRLLRNWTTALYILSLLLLVGVLVFGVKVNGTTGWFEILGFSFQPVELVKIVLVLVLAKYFSEKARRQVGWREILGSAFLAAFPAGLVLLQPDFGSALDLMGIWIILLFFAGLKWKHALVLTLIGVAASLFAWFVLFGPIQRDRVLTFIDPSRDPTFRGYNVKQAIIAVGAGEIFGRGLGFGSQSQLRFLPEAQTDFIVAVIAEELGFVGLLFILAAFLLLFYRLFKLIQTSRDDYTSFLLIGIFAVLFIQVAVNVGMNLGLLPVTGIGLPFVSYGGSSLMMAFILIGLAQSIAVRASAAR